MFKIFIRKGFYFLLSLLYIYVFQSITRLVVGVTMFPTIFTLDLFIFLLLLSPIFLLKSDLYTRIYSYVIVFVFCFLFILNINYYFVSQTPFYPGLLQYFSQAKEVMSKDFIKFDVIIYGLLIYGSFVGINIVFNKLIFKNKLNTNKKYLPYGIITSFVLASLSLVSYNLSINKVYKNAEEFYIYDKPSEIINLQTQLLRNSSLTTYGMLTFYISDINVTYRNAKVAELVDSISDKKNENNQFHGLLEGYNIITVMIETGIYDGISEELTPTLFKLMNEGINFSNTYTKNKTSMSEIIGFTGSYPLDSFNYNYNYSDKNSIYKLILNEPEDWPEDKEYTLEYTLPTLLRDKYQVSFFHDGAGLYARDNLINQFGFEYWKHEFHKVHPSGTKGWDFDGSYEMDSDYINLILDKDYEKQLYKEFYSKDEPFYTFYTTLSTHGPYNNSYEEVNKKLTTIFTEKGYVQKFDEHFDSVYKPLYGELDSTTYNNLKYLVCCFMDLDDAIAQIVNRLKEENLFDNTIFVLYGDHEAYYENLSKKLSNSTKPYDIEQYKTALFFYNKDLVDKYKEVYNMDNEDRVSISTYVSPYIIVPTLLDLLGIDYETEYYYSKSFFDFTSEYDGIFYSNELSAFFSDSFYSSTIGSFEYMNSNLNDIDRERILAACNAKLIKLTKINEHYKRSFKYKE